MFATECNDGEVSADEAGTISSPGYPNDYADEMRCWWNIRTTPPNRVRLNISDFHTERGYDFVAVNRRLLTFPHINPLSFSIIDIYQIHPPHFFYKQYRCLQMRNCMYVYHSENV